MGVLSVFGIRPLLLPSLLFMGTMLKFRFITCIPLWSCSLTKKSGAAKYHKLLNFYWVSRQLITRLKDKKQFIFLRSFIDDLLKWVLPPSWGVRKGSLNSCSLKGTSIVWPSFLKQQKDFADNEVLKTWRDLGAWKVGKIFNHAMLLPKKEWVKTCQQLTDKPQYETLWELYLSREIISCT